MIGDRIRFKGKRGYIRYVGPVSSSDGNASVSEKNWLGVEWDNPGEGIHDGSIKDEATGQVRRYFRCSEGKGSFVKIEKAELPQDFEVVYRLKYGSVEEPLDVLAKPPSERDLGTAGLAFSSVGKSRSTDSIAQFSFIHCLDISNTLFSTWDEIFGMAARFPSLQELIVCDNPNLGITHLSHITHLPLLNLLALNGCDHAAFQYVIDYVKAPSIKELRLAKCGLVSIPKTLPSQIQLIDLSYNLVESIDIEFLQTFPASLRRLNLSGNPLSLSSSRLKEPCVNRVIEINLDKTLIESLEEIEKLDALFPELLELRLWNCPLTDSLIEQDNDIHKVRARILVRMPELRILNGTQITAQERLDAELYCLKTKDSFRRRIQLIAKHGYAEVQEQESRARKIVVVFHFKDDSVERKLTMSTTLASALTVFRRLFSISDADQLRVTVHQGVGQVREVEVEEKTTLHDLVDGKGEILHFTGVPEQ